MVSCHHIVVSSATDWCDRLASRTSQGLSCCLSSSSVRCPESDVYPVFVDLESSTQADGAQSSRVPVPLPKDPYEAIRQDYLDGTDTESEPFEDPIDTNTTESPLTVAPPTSLPKSLSASMAKVAAMFESAFRKRFRSSYESLPSLSPLDLPLRKRYQGTSELVEDSEEDDDEEDEEIEESVDSNSVSEDAEDESPTAEDEDLAAGVEGPGTDDESQGLDDESYGLDDEGHGLDDESHGLDDEGYGVESDGLGLEEEEEVVPGGQQQAATIMGTTISAPLGLGYGALRRRELALEEDHVYSTFEVGQGSGSALESERPERVSASRQPTLTTWTDPEDDMVYIDVPAYLPPAPPVQTPLSPEWTSGSLPISLSPSVVHSSVSSPMIPLTVPSHVATPATTEIEGFFTKLGAQVEMQGGLIRDHVVRLEELSPAIFERYDRDIRELFNRSGLLGMRFSPRGQTDTQRAALWHAINDIQGENQDLRLQFAEERRARLELAEVVNSMRRGQEPRGGA
ncbi:hypothetical protein Tco_0846135 [Tanacetum coccineum]